MHHRHVALGAKMFNLGEWKRPEFYTSVAEECRAVRERVGLIDVGTLGKLEMVGADAVTQGLKGMLDPAQQRALDKLAPETLRLPTGSNARIDYAAEGGPRVEARVQELYGVTTHPTVGPGRAPLTLALLSPAHRPIQITKDLPAFWDGSWREVRAEMKGRYPRHVWPENPREADPTTRAKPRGT